MRVAPCIVTLLASTARLAVEAFFFGVPPQNSRPGASSWMAADSHPWGRPTGFSQLCLSSTRQLQLAA